MDTQQSSKGRGRIQRHLKRRECVPDSGAIDLYSPFGEHSLDTLHIACDTEFEGAHTLTIQFATRVGQTVVVQVYHSPAINLQPIKPEMCLPPELKTLCGEVILRPLKRITRILSPLAIISDLCDVMLAPTSHWDDEGVKLEVGKNVNAIFIGHYLPADFFRIFGSRYYAKLLDPAREARRIVVNARTCMSFKDAGNPYQAPVICEARVGKYVHDIALQTFDTMLPFGSGSLDSLAHTFLGVGKGEGLTSHDLTNMAEAYRKRPEQTLAYATRDAILTLLLFEQMQARDREMYEVLGVPPASIPPLRQTLGRRAAEVITTFVERHAAGTVALSKHDGTIAGTRLKDLMSQGSARAIAKQSRFEAQTGETHGGLLFTRSPTVLFHEAPGSLADVDMTSCYPNIIASLNLYLGRPIIHEPGSKGMRLKDAVGFLQRHAVGKDAWIVKVTGDITTSPNALIPSTHRAWTNANYSSRARKQRAHNARKNALCSTDGEVETRQGGTVLFTDRIESGIVTWATWTMIQALPAALREEYENLEVDTVLFYPRDLTATGAEGFDKLVQRLSFEDAPWSSTIDMQRQIQQIVERFDRDNVALCIPIGALARKIIELRAQARRQHGKGSGHETCWKKLANTMYGVLASRHHTTNNTVAANIITATARAGAFALHQSLNGFQIITDGCIYRRDQVPSITFEQCLDKAPDYAINRAGFRGPFLTKLPQDDVSFTKWYRGHVKRFFSVTGPARKEFDWLLRLQKFEHKKGRDGTIAFDGLCSDSSSNNMKLVRSGDTWECLDHKARGFTEEAKKEIGPWIIGAYAGDQYSGPPELTSSSHLLTFHQAAHVALAAVDHLESIKRAGDAAEETRVLVPLGMPQREYRAYTIIKPTQFLFRDPAQRNAFLRAFEKFRKHYGTGPELLSLRRAYRDRRHGSLADILMQIYAYIRASGDNPSKEFNMTRSIAEQDRCDGTFQSYIESLRKQEERRLYESVDADELDEHAALTGLFANRQMLMNLH